MNCNYAKYMTKNVEIIIGKTIDKGIDEFREGLKRFASEHEISDISTSDINSGSFGERIVATILYE
jgi:hypothetical protein